MTPDESDLAEFKLLPHDEHDEFNALYQAIDTNDLSSTIYWFHTELELSVYKVYWYDYFVVHREKVTKLLPLALKRSNIIDFALNMDEDGYAYEYATEYATETGDIKLIDLLISRRASGSWELTKHLIEQYVFTNSD